MRRLRYGLRGPLIALLLSVLCWSSPAAAQELMEPGFAYYEVGDLDAPRPGPRAPAMMLRLGYTNLKMGNIQEAEAYFNLLKRNYPSSMSRAGTFIHAKITSAMPPLKRTLTRLMQSLRFSPSSFSLSRHSLR